MSKAHRVETGQAAMAYDQLPMRAPAHQRGGHRTRVGCSAYGDSAGATAPLLGLQSALDGHYAGVEGRLHQPGLDLGRCLLAEQQPGAKHLEAVPPPGPVDRLGNPVQCLGVGIGDGVVEVRQNLPAPVLHGGQQHLEVGLHDGGDRRSVGVVGQDCLVFGQFVDGVERLLQLVGGGQFRGVVQPHIHVEPLFVVQRGIPLVQQRLGAEPVPALGGLLELLQPDAHPLHAVVGCPDDVELVDDHRNAGEHLVHHVPVGAPHVDGHALDHAPVLEVVQPAREGVLVPGGQHLYGPLLAHVGQHQAHLPVDLRLVDAQPDRQFGLVLGVQLGDELPGQVADGLVVAPNLLGDAHEGVPQAPGPDQGSAALRHAPVRLDARQRLEEGLPAVPALVALHLGLELGGRAPDRAVRVGHQLGAVLVQVADGAALLAGLRLRSVLRFQQVVPFGVGGLGQHGPAVEVEDVGHPRIVVWNRRHSVGGQKRHLVLHRVDAAQEVAGLPPVVRVAPLLSGCERPGHRIGRLQARPHQTAAQGGGLQAKAVKLQVRPLRLDGAEDRFDSPGVPVALADTAHAHPHARLQPVAVEPDVLDVVGWRVALEDRQDVDATGIALQQRVVPLDGQPVMVRDRQAGLLQHELLAHVVLRHGRQEVAVRGPALDMSCVLADRVGVAAVLVDDGEGPAVHYPVAHLERTPAVLQPIHADEGCPEVFGVRGLVQADEEAHSFPHENPIYDCNSSCRFPHVIPQSPKLIAPYECIRVKSLASIATPKRDMAASFGTTRTVPKAHKRKG